MIKKVLTIVSIVVISVCYFIACDEQSVPEKIWEGDYFAHEHGYSVSPLKGYTIVTGKLYIGDTLEENLDDLISLKEVGSNLFIVRNPKLENIYGLSNLKIFGGGTVCIEANDSLQNIDGLRNIEPTLYDHTVYITENTALLNIDGLIWLTSVHDLDVYDNTVLEDILGLSNIDSFTGIFNVYQPNICQTALDGVCEDIDISLGERFIVGGDDGC